MSRRQFAPIPSNGSFYTTRPKVIEHCIKAQKAAASGAYVGIRGYPCIITKVNMNPDLSATIYYRRIKQHIRMPV